MSRRRESDVGAATRGLVAGLVATVPMSAFFSAAQRAGFLGQLPPRRVVATVSPQLEAQDQVPVATIAHYLIGGSGGAVYGLLTKRSARGPVSGMVWGLVVWAIGYEFLMPRAAEMPLAHRDDRRRAAAILVAHLVYGCVLGLVSKAGRK
jgi:ammonia channel protein AmtB